MNEIHLTKKDFKLEWFSGQGAGGQHRNKHQNCCRITHIESGLTRTGQTSRSRSTNQKEAFTKLAHDVIEWYRKGEEINEHSKRPTEVIRNYHEPRNEVLDKATGYRQEYKTVVIDGELADMINARRKAKGANDGF
jgi:protein subunit release factor A